MDELKPMGNLGQGASGVVMRVLHVPSNMDFALKVVNIPFDQNEKKIRHLISELKTLFMSKCPNIVSFHGAFYKVHQSSSSSSSSSSFSSSSSSSSSSPSSSSCSSSSSSSSSLSRSIWR
jgi:serine/threonine protein kinase